MELIRVGLGSFSYDICINNNLLALTGQYCRDLALKGRAAVITNPVVSVLYAEKVFNSLASAGFDPVLIVIPDGEAYKNSHTLNSIYDRLIEEGLDRSCFIVALGGGVVGDLAGFAAATYLRGIPFVQLPTTLLAQVDSSVGGKTGIDHPRGKNLIGAFYQPKTVLIDVSTLLTLPEREYRAGLAEVVKYGVVLDRPFFDFLEKSVDAINQRDHDLLCSVVSRCCAIKANVVEQDERESGLRAVLNYGHTLGHAYEALSGYDGLVHGEAVSIGMVQASAISMKEGLCSSEDCARIADLLLNLGLPVVPPEASVEKIEKILSSDKKSRAGVVHYICNQGIGGYAVREFTPLWLASFSVSST